MIYKDSLKVVVYSVIE